MTELSESRGHYTPSSLTFARIFPLPVVDTETHVFIRAWPLETSPGMSAIDPYTRTAHSGEVLIAEMDRAGVDRAILIGYDGYDFADYMHRFGSDPGDFMGGRTYTREWVRRYPDRLSYVTTLRHPRIWDAIDLLTKELDAGAVGVKIFPAYLRLQPDSKEIGAIFDLLRTRRAAAVFGFEDMSPPATPSLSETYEAIGRLATDYPDVPIQLNHGGNASPGTDDIRTLFAVVNSRDDILVSTSVLGGTLMVWEDEWRYPFRSYLEHLHCFAEGLEPDKLAWGTDWPWFEGVLKYPQLLQSVVDHATFLAEDDKRGYLGGNALRHWKLDSAAEGVAG